MITYSAGSPLLLVPVFFLIRIPHSSIIADRKTKSITMTNKYGARVSPWRTPTLRLTCSPQEVHHLYHKGPL